MTREQKGDFIKYWIPTVIFVCMVTAYVWSSATRFQEIDSRSSENKGDIKELKEDYNEKFNRINDKLDILIRRDR